MTLYAMDLDQMLTTVRATLAEKIGPGVTDGSARLELGMVIEQIDNLIGRVQWDASGVARAIGATDGLARALGVEPAGDTLAERRRQVEATLRATYVSGDPASIEATATAVAEFSTADIRDQISIGMRGALPF